LVGGQRCGDQLEDGVQMSFSGKVSDLRNIGGFDESFAVFDDEEKGISTTDRDGVEVDGVKRQLIDVRTIGFGFETDLDLVIKEPIEALRSDRLLWGFRNHLELGLRILR
jgi:hypothetical protein